MSPSSKCLITRPPFQKTRPQNTLGTFSVILLELSSLSAPTIRVLTYHLLPRHPHLSPPPPFPAHSPKGRSSPLSTSCPPRGKSKTMVIRPEPTRRESRRTMWPATGRHNTKSQRWRVRLHYQTSQTPVNCLNLPPDPHSSLHLQPLGP